MVTSRCSFPLPAYVHTYTMKLRMCLNRRMFIDELLSLSNGKTGNGIIYQNVWKVTVMKTFTHLLAFPKEVVDFTTKVQES